MNRQKIDKILTQNSLGDEEIKYLFSVSDPEEVSLINRRADQLRAEFCGESVHLRGLINISNYCDKNCAHCSLRLENYSQERYRMEPDEIIETAKEIIHSGIYTILLQSGEDKQFDADMIAHIIYSIKKMNDVAITISLGERGFDEYKSWKIAGADRYILNHDNCYEQYDSENRTEKSFSGRIQHLKYLKRLGFQIGSGILVGLPNQSIENIVESLLEMKELNADMTAIYPFLPVPFTPYQNRKSVDLDFVIKTISIARIVLKDVHIPAVTKLDALNSNGRERALLSGANVILSDFTPGKYSVGDREPGNLSDVENRVALNKKIQARLGKLGRSISYSKGDSLKNHYSISI